MHTEERSRLVRVFQHFARHEFHGHSPRYEFLSEVVADRPELAGPLLAAGPGQRRPILFFAAVQYLLRTTAHGHPLAEYLPGLGGSGGIGSDLAAAFVDLAQTRRDELAQLCATRSTQTNEANRAALLRPGFGRVAELWPDRPLHLVELGASAGLLLRADRYACRYLGSDGRTATYGPAGLPPTLTMTCEVRGTVWPEPAAADPAVAARTGIDLAPIDAADSRATDWLRACVWPEQTDRLARLDAALAEVGRDHLRLVAGDMVESLPRVLATVSDDALPCVFASNAVTYLGRSDRRRLVAVLAEIGAGRDLAVLLNEASEAGAELFQDHRPAAAGPAGVLSVGLLTLVTWRGGRIGVDVLARTGPHGQWLEWLDHA